MGNPLEEYGNPICRVRMEAGESGSEMNLRASPEALGTEMMDEVSMNWYQ